jgi:molecular chaperone DnaK
MAKRSAALAPLDVVQFVKRYMGDPNFRHMASDGSQFRAEEISAFILKRLKEDAEAFLGESVRQAVVIVPAYFDSARRKATADACAIAGLELVRILNEPTAAALSYGADHLPTGRFLVHDLGGGTFDVTVMEAASSDELRVLAVEGNRNLGGFDFDNELMSTMMTQLCGREPERGLNPDEMVPHRPTASTPGNDVTRRVLAAEVRRAALQRARRGDRLPG